MAQTHSELIRQITGRLASEKIHLSPRLIRAFQLTDRKFFVPRQPDPEDMYGDYPIPIGFGQTNSQPFTVAFMLQLLAPEAGNRVMDIGSGSGWTTALLSLLCAPGGSVHPVERIPELLNISRKNIRRWKTELGKQRSPALKQSSEIHFKVAGGSAGIPGIKFDRILVSASATEIPDELLEQLSSPGIMIIPVGNAIMKIEHSPSGRTHTERFEGFRFVPFIRNGE